MKMLDRLLSHEDAPVQIGRALLSEKPMWLVTCVIKKQEVFGQVSMEESYEVQAASEERACESVRSYLTRSHPDLVIESVQAMRRSRF